LVETGVTSASMAADRKRLFARLEELGIASTTVEHDPMFTVEQSQALRERIPGAHTKNLFLTDKDGRVALVVAKDETRVELKLVASRLGFGRLSFGNAELLAKLLGVAPGSVRPFALINDCEARVTVRRGQLPSAREHCHDAARHRRSHALHPRLRSQAARAASLLTSLGALPNRRSLPIFPDEIGVRGNLGAATCGV